MQKANDITPALKQFRENLTVPQDDKKSLMQARATTRTFIRSRLASAIQATPQVGSYADLPTNPKVKFLTQGSCAYGTLNAPAHVPPQRMDMDDGVYFPMSVLATVMEPGFPPGILLDAMGKVLHDLADQKGWKMEPMPSCCRMVIQEGGQVDKHIDLPLYAIPDSEMDDLDSRKDLTVFAKSEARFADFYQEFGIPFHPLLASGKVLLVHRDGWVESDPREIIDWVADCKEKYGAMFINICRYLKAWRDHQWKEKSKLSSIAIMSIVAHAFGGDKFRQSDNEGEWLLWATQSILECLDVGVDDPAHPGDPSKRLDKNISDKEKADIKQRAGDLAADLGKALHDGNVTPDEICQCLRRHFGSRFPDNGKLISLCKAAAVASSTTTVSSTRASPPFGGE